MQPSEAMLNQLASAKKGAMHSFAAMRGGGNGGAVRFNAPVTSEDASDDANPSATADGAWHARVGAFPAALALATGPGNAREGISLPAHLWVRFGVRSVVCVCAVSPCAINLRL